MLNSNQIKINTLMLTFLNLIFVPVPLGRIPPDVEGLNVEQWANSSSTQLTWDSAAINTSRVDIDIFHFESVNLRLLDQSFKSYKNIPNTGKYILKLEDDNDAAIATPKPLVRGIA